MCWVSSTTQHTVNMMEWRSSRSRRVVRSTLAAEAYSLSETSEAVDWTRVVLGELLYTECENRHVFEKQSVSGDARKSLYDCRVLGEGNVGRPSIEKP